MTPKQKKYAVLAFGIGAIALFAYLFMRTRSFTGSNAVATSAPTPAPGNNVYAINFPGTEPNSLPGTNIVLGGTTIGTGCGCCDSGSTSLSQAQTMQNLAAVAGDDDVLLSMLANIQPTGQSDLGYAFGGL